MDLRICVALICWGLCVTARSTSITTTINPYTDASQTDGTLVAGDPRDYHNQPRIIEQFSHRNPDGSYEFRYELSDGNTRYERGYFVNRNNAPSLVVTGYYAYRLEDGRYTTVFYNADHNGYRQQASTTSQRWPDLPRTIDVTPGEVELVEGVSSSTLLPRRYAEDAENSVTEEGSAGI